MSKTVAEKGAPASVRKGAIRRVLESSPLNGVVDALRNLRLTRNNAIESSVSFGSSTFEQATQSRRDVEFRKAQALEWYTRQKSRMM